MLEEFDLNIEFQNFKREFINSKKYWIIYVVLVLFALITQMNVSNYYQPVEEIIFFVIFAIAGIFCITFFKCHSGDNEIHKTALIILLIFGIFLCFLTPTLGAYDEVEHFVRAEMTSSGVLFPEYENGSYLTIQSTLDLIEGVKDTHEDGFDYVDMSKASVTKVDSDTKPINYTLVKYPSAFAQNPFFGYLPQAIGIALAKLLSLNAIWLVWLGRIFNVAVYAGIVSYAVKKTPILKVPMIIFACVPLALFTVASMSIDGLICGLSILAVSYFFYMLKSPKRSLNKLDILKFSLIIVLLGLCKVTCFALILLLFVIPKENFEDGKFQIASVLSVVLIVLIALLWTKYYANPGFFKSFRAEHAIINHINSTQQIDYMLNHLNHGIVSVLRYPRYLGYFYDLVHSMVFNQIYMMFLGAVILFYPHEKFDMKSRIMVLIVAAIFFMGTILTFLLSWTPVGDVYTILGLQTRYLLPILALLPFAIGINHIETNKDVIDSYMILATICFLAFDAMYIAALAY